MSPSELCPWHGKWNEMPGRAELCGRMTNGSLGLLGSGFWEPGQQKEPFVHLPATIAGSDKEQAVDFPAHYWQELPPGNQHFKQEEQLFLRPRLGKEHPFHGSCCKSQSLSTLQFHISRYV